MNIRKREERNIRLVNYLFESHLHTFFNAATIFDLSMNQVFRINKRYKLRAVEKVLLGEEPKAIAEELGVPELFVIKAKEEYDAGKLQFDALNPPPSEGGALQGGAV